MTQRRVLSVCSHGHGHGQSHNSGHNGHGQDTKTMNGRSGFIEEMRAVAMKLHTKEQAPKEGQKEAKKPEERPVKQWTPSREGYLRYLTEVGLVLSRVHTLRHSRFASMSLNHLIRIPCIFLQSKYLYEKVEGIIAASAHPDLQRFQNSGLERAAALAQDCEWVMSEYGLQTTCSPAGCTACGGCSPGLAYGTQLEKLAAENVPAFICHYYNIYFAHTAGGMMIGKKVADECLDGKELAFYKWEGDVKEYMGRVRDTINLCAESWTQEEKQACLDETAESFKKAGALLGLIAS